MGLKIARLWQRLATMLMFHGKLREENRDKARMDKAAHKIRKLTYLLENYNGKSIETPGFHE